jgi:hypothetical protein
MAGVKGRSGRRCRGEERISIAPVLNKALEYALRYFNNPLISDKEKGLYSMPLITRLVPTKTATELSLAPAQDRLVLDKYTNPIPDSTLDMITGNTASPIDIVVSASAMQGNTQQGIDTGIEHDKP